MEKTTIYIIMQLVVNMKKVIVYLTQRTAKKVYIEYL